MRINAHRAGIAEEEHCTRRDGQRSPGRRIRISGWLLDIGFIKDMPVQPHLRPLDHDGVAPQGDDALDTQMLRGVEFRRACHDDIPPLRLPMEERRVGEPVREDTLTAADAGRHPSAVCAIDRDCSMEDDEQESEDKDAREQRIPSSPHPVLLGAIPRNDWQAITRRHRKTVQ